MSKPKFTSTLIEPPNFSIRLNSHKLPTTQKMVEDAIFELNNRKGFSLYKLKKHISDTYHIELSQQRKSLINKELHVLLANGTLINITGRGLTGSLRMESKKGRSTSRFNNEMKSSATISAEDENFLIKRKKTSSNVRKKNKVTAATPPNNGVHTLLPPNAPQRNSMPAVGILGIDHGTPCSSGGRVVHKRKLLSTTQEEFTTIGSQAF